MCGIAGIWSTQETLTEREFTRALSLLNHRGPDESAVYKSGDWWMGTSRLEITGGEEGRQPIADHNGCLSFNGEIYNFRQLAKNIGLTHDSDTALLFHHLKQKGIADTLYAIDGMFAFAYLDESVNSLSLVRDRVGQKPLYYSFKKGDYFIFGSEIKVVVELLQLLNQKLTLNQEAIYHYLCFSHIPQPETIYKEIRSVKAGHLLQWKGDALYEEPYWEYDYTKNNSISYQEAKDQVRSRIREATSKRISTSVATGLFLSGGLDSSIIAYEASQLAPQTRCYTVNYQGETLHNEHEIASRTANRYGLQHEVLPVTLSPLQMLDQLISVYDQPFADSSAIPNLAIAKAASLHSKVILNGDGGDEQFGGYRRYTLAHHHQLIKWLNFLAPFIQKTNPSRRSLGGFIQRAIRLQKYTGSGRYFPLTIDMWDDKSLKEVWIGGDKIKSSASDLVSGHNKKGLSEMRQLMQWDRHHNFLSGILVKMDMATMAYGVEARSPLLDHSLFEFTSTLPDHFLIHNFKGKRILKDAYKDALPTEILTGKKVSFEAPINQWVQHDFKEQIQDLLLSPNALIYNYLDRAHVKGIVAGSLLTDRNTAYMQYSLLILERWLQINKHVLQTG